MGIQGFLLSSFLCCASFSVFGQQTVLNVARSTESLLQYAISDIDSITYSYYAIVVSTDTAYSEFGLQPPVVAVGTISFDDASVILARGVCLDTIPNPDLYDIHTVDGNGIGTFTSYPTGLETITNYFLRAYARTGTDTIYGNQVEFITSFW